jgi:hypothetical protein
VHVRLVARISLCLLRLQAPSLALGRVGAASASGAGSAPFQRRMTSALGGASLSGGEDPARASPGPSPPSAPSASAYCPTQTTRCSPPEVCRHEEVGVVAAAHLAAETSQCSPPEVCRHDEAGVADTAHLAAENPGCAATTPSGALTRHISEGHPPRRPKAERSEGRHPSNETVSSDAVRRSGAARGRRRAPDEGGGPRSPSAAPPNESATRRWNGAATGRAAEAAATRGTSDELGAAISTQKRSGPEGGAWPGRRRSPGHRSPSAALPNAGATRR